MLSFERYSLKLLDKILEEGSRDSSWGTAPLLSTFTSTWRHTWLFLPGLLPPFLHTASNHKLEAVTAWEQGDHTVLWHFQSSVTKKLTLLLLVLALTRMLVSSAGSYPAFRFNAENLITCIVGYCKLLCVWFWYSPTWQYVLTVIGTTWLLLKFWMSQRQQMGAGRLLYCYLASW